MWSKVVFDSVPSQYKTQEMLDEALDDYANALKFVHDWYKTQKMCNKALNTCFILFDYVLENKMKLSMIV